MSSRWRHPGWSGAAIYAVAAGLVGAVLTVVARLQVAGVRGRAAVVRRLPDGPVIVISNHTSYADGLLLAIVCRRLGRSARMLAAAGVFKAPVIGPVARRIGFIPVNRGAANAAEALGPAAEALAAGELVAIFPEGRLTRDPDRWPEKAKTGAVRLALQTGAPIVPVALEGAYRVVGRRKLVSSLLRNVLLRPKVATAVGEPIDVRGLLQGPQTPDEIRRVTDVVWSRLIDLVEQLRGQEAPDAVGVEPDAVTPV
ncbi:MAG TPA: lysophospholipid acyltransferase family protein [Ilumatobacter sp.]|nr:lysophospholipid acyltransferase family protein [Ilumatobacter sp.]